MDETNIDKLTRLVDKAKALSVVSNVHSMTPPQKEPDNPSNQVAIIDALRAAPRVLSIYFRLRGQMYNPDTKEIVQISTPIMNERGALKFVGIVMGIAEEIEWSNFGEDEINPRIMKYYEDNYPYFTFWHGDYDLDTSDFNIVGSLLMAAIDGTFHKSKNAKYLNVVGRVYSEDMLGKVLTSTEDNKKKRMNIIDRLNPFKRDK
jgi:hypothetical protein